MSPSGRRKGAPLGQHFLASSAVTRDIARLAGVAAGDTVVEIGPGKGMLTRALLEKGARVIAFEKDSGLAKRLSMAHSEEIRAGKFEIYEKDVRDEDMEVFLPEAPYFLVANIPYYITGFILERFLTAPRAPKQITLMVQKEVADRIVARDAKESILSISVKLYGKPRIVKKVPRHYFSPPPNVDSAVLIIDKNEAPPPYGVAEGTIKIVKRGFAHKRKLLLGNLSVYYAKEVVRGGFQSCALGENVRAENLSPASWRCLSEKITAASRSGKMKDRKGSTSESRGS